MNNCERFGLKKKKKKKRQSISVSPPKASVCSVVKLSPSAVRAMPRFDVYLHSSRGLRGDWGWSQPLNLLYTPPHLRKLNIWGFFFIHFREQKLRSVTFENRGRCASFHRDTRVLYTLGGSKHSKKTKKAKNGSEFTILHSTHVTSAVGRRLTAIELQHGDK